MAKTQKARAKGAGCLWKKGNRFYLKTVTEGKSKSVLLRGDDNKPCMTRPQAEMAADKLAPALALQSREDLGQFVAVTRRLKAEARPVLLSDVWETYLGTPTRPDSGKTTMEFYRQKVFSFADWSATQNPPVVNVRQVTADVAGKYLSEIAARSSTRNYNAYLQCLRMVFEHIAEPCALDENPFEKFQRKTLETCRHEALTIEQVQTVLRCFDVGFFRTTEIEGLAAGGGRKRSIATLEWRPLHVEQMRVLFYLLAYTGARLQDAAQIKWQNIDLVKNEIRFTPRKTKRKNNKPVALPIHDNLRSAIADAVQWCGANTAGDDCLLPDVAARYAKNRTGLSKDVAKMIGLAIGEKTSFMPENVTRKLKASRFSAHSLRHYFVSSCAAAGVPMAIVSELVGHSTVQMSMHYFHGTAEGRSKAIAALPCLGTPNDETAVKRDLQARLAVLAEGATVEQLENAIAAMEK